MPKQYVGIDIAKSTFAVCVIEESGKVLFQEPRLPQSRPGFERLLQLLEKTPGDALVGMESTSIYQLPLVAFLSEREIPTVILNPSLVNKFAKLDLRPTKTDKKDARLIAEFLRQRQPSPRSDPGWSEVQLLSRGRERLIVGSSALKVHIHQALAVLFPELEEAGINPSSDGDAKTPPSLSLRPQDPSGSDRGGALCLSRCLPRQGWSERSFPDRRSVDVGRSFGGHHFPGLGGSAGGVLPGTVLPGGAKRAL